MYRTPFFLGMLIKVSLKATGASGAQVFDETHIARTFREGVNRKSYELFIIKIKLYLIEGGGGGGQGCWECT